MRATCRASGARREKREYGTMVKWSRCPNLDLMAWVRASQSSCPFFFPNFFFNLFFCIMYVTQTPQTTQKAHRQRRVRATTSWLQRYTRLPPAAEQEATLHACGSLSALYYCSGFLFNSWLLLLPDPGISRPAGLCCCVMHAATGTTTHIFHNVVIWYHMRMIPIACCMFFNSFLRHSPRHVPEGNLT